MKNSKQRDLVLEIVNNSKDHPTAEDVYIKAREHIPNISLGTVYRNLNTLVDKKSIRRIKTGSETYRYDNSSLKHNHFICKICNNVLDVDVGNVEDVKTIDGNIVYSTDITYFGICKNCNFKEGLKWN